jgi:hypothetical protein
MVRVPGDGVGTIMFDSSSTYREDKSVSTGQIIAGALEVAQKQRIQASQGTH